MSLKRKIFFGILFSIAIYFLLGTTNAFADDYQYALWFMDDLNISQLPEGHVSHTNTQNFDVVGADIFAPFDCKVVKVYPDKSSGNTVVIQSVDKVHYADGTLDYMCMAFAHKDDISKCIDDFNTGRTIKQGEVFYRTGTFGYITGEHSHVTCIRGQFKDDNGNYINDIRAEFRGYWEWNGEKMKKYSPHNDISPETALFISVKTNTYTTNGSHGLQFKYIDKLTVTADINSLGEYKLSWNAIPGATNYTIGVYNDNRILGNTNETSYEGCVRPGEGGEFYIVGWKDGESDSICASEPVSVFIEDEDIEFNDSKFEEFLISWPHNNICDWNLDKKITFYDFGVSNFELFLDGDGKELPFDDCMMTCPQNINFIKRVSITNVSNIKASQFKGMKNISSIEELDINDVNGIDDFEKFISYFPYLKKINIGHKRMSYDKVDYLIDSCSFLDNYNGLTSISLCADLSCIDWNSIIKHKDTLAQFVLNGLGKDYSQMELTEVGKLVNLKELNFSSIKIKNGSFINKLSKLETLYLNDVGFDESFVLSNESIKNLDIAYGGYGFEDFHNVIFGDLSGVENLWLSGNYWNGYTSSIDLNWNHIENLKNLKYLRMSNFQMLHDLNFLTKLTNLESIDLYEVAGAASFPNLDNLNKLIGIDYRNGTIKDISNLEGLVSKDTFKRLYIDKQYELNPNSKNNLKIIEKMEDRKKTDNTIVCEVEGYKLKDFVNDINNAVGEIATISMGVIKTFRPVQTVLIEKLITEENFPILESYDVNVVSGGGAGKSFGDKVGSKDKIQIVNTLGEIVQEYTVIVPGDVTGNGEVKLYDAFKILNDSVKKVAIDELDVKIRDYNEDEKVTTYDALQYMKETMKEE